MNHMPANEILNQIIALISSFEHPGVRTFKDNLVNWGDQWKAVSPQWLPVANLLPSDLHNGIVRLTKRDVTMEEIAHLLGLFHKYKDQLHWEQSYSKADKAVSRAMLAGYGFAEIIGKNGPFLSDRIRCGIGIWGPHISYPKHRHQAEEIYLVMSGSAVFTLDGSTSMSAFPRDVIHVASMRDHGFETQAQPLIVLYLWQSGDLREKSTFV
ncbi:MAG: hypothetical protein GKR95_21825 [Gammaproteobacteria bacterium]|nr:hypothetical protein [Gammaproteobacteria bacterium]